MSARKINVPEKQKERDPDFINAEIALKRAAQKARQRAGQAGIGVIVVEDGKIVEERPDRSR
jgi:tRNA(Arg) A34 adenosine deaminase TadA